jgi:DUF2905 family protein
MKPGMFGTEPVEQLGRALLLLGAALLVVGGFFCFAGKLPFRLGRLPGDFVYRGERGTFYFPLATCFVVSAVLSLMFWLLNHFRR